MVSHLGLYSFVRKPQMFEFERKHSSTVRRNTIYDERTSCARYPHLVSLCALCVWLSQRITCTRAEEVEKARCAYTLNCKSVRREDACTHTHTCGSAASQPRFRAECARVPPVVALCQHTYPLPGARTPTVNPAGVLLRAPAIRHSIIKIDK